MSTLLLGCFMLLDATLYIDKPYLKITVCNQHM